MTLAMQDPSPKQGISLLRHKWGVFETPNTNRVAALRTALRSAPDSRGGDQRAIEAAASPLIDAFFERLLRFCNRLTRSAGCGAWLEGEDLAILAWEKMLRYLTGPGGDRVKDDQHFERLLMTAARSCFLDVLERRSHENCIELDAPVGENGESSLRRVDLLPDTRATAEELLLPKDSSYLKLVEELFSDEESFRKTYRQKNQRHPRNYKALVLYQLGAHWREEVGGRSIEDPQLAALIRHYVKLLGVPEDLWEQVERAAMTAETEARGSYFPDLLAAVNTVCGTNLNDRGTLAVLRHEMNRFATMVVGDAFGDKSALQRMAA